MAKSPNQNQFDAFIEAASHGHRNTVMPPAAKRQVLASIQSADVKISSVASSRVVFLGGIAATACILLGVVLFQDALLPINADTNSETHTPLISPEPANDIIELNPVEELGAPLPAQVQDDEEPAIDEDFDLISPLLVEYLEQAAEKRVAKSSVFSGTPPVSLGTGSVSAPSLPSSFSGFRKHRPGFGPGTPPRLASPPKFSKFKKSN